LNILFLTQGKSLSVFYDVARSIGKKANLGKVGFYIADSAFFNQFKQENPNIASGRFELLKEWEIIERSKSISPDLQRLLGYEKSLGDPFLWNALVSDRRIFLGKRATLEQDYLSRFDHERMLAILQVGIEEMEALFDRVKPDLVVGFICVTIGEYLAYLISKCRNIQFLNLRPTRVKNYFFAGENIFEPSNRLENKYRLFMQTGIPSDLKEKVGSYLAQVRKTHAMYEGVLPPPGDTTTDVTGEGDRKERNLFQTIRKLTREYYDFEYGQYRYDNHHRGVFYPIWFQKVKRPIRNWRNKFCLNRFYLQRDSLENLSYAFYPLHKEPEVTLLVYGRPYLNQIEVVRNFARSLPMGMKLVVKEHPGSVGYRPLSYYKKLLAIPNVILASPEMTSRDLIEKARLITIIGGSVGLEGLIMQKPVLHLGNVPFSFLPDTMIRKAQDLERLGWEIHEILENYKHNEDALRAYIAAVMDSSVPVDFYSILLGRRAVYRPDQNQENIDSQYKVQIDRLSEYLMGCLSDRLENRSNSLWGENI
jgi:hypothetical protein